MDNSEWEKMPIIHQYKCATQLSLHIEPAVDYQNKKQKNVNTNTESWEPYEP
jgi:hypothetical protein